MLLLESALLIGVRGLDGAMSDIGELEGLEEKEDVGRVLWSRRAIEAVSEGSLMGVKADTGEGRKMLKDFLRCLSEDKYLSAAGLDGVGRKVRLTYPT